MDAKHFLAFDYGAESGRGILFTLSNDKLAMEEIHRWPNRPAILAGTRYWDFPYLYTEMLATMKRVAERGVTPDAIGVDTWGVDFGLLDGNGRLVGLPVQYRDSRTDGIHDYSDPTLSRSRIFELTGYEPWQIASLFQVLAMQREGNPQLDIARRFLNMPDLFNCFLTGRAANEKSILNTSNFMDIDGQWCGEVISAFRLNRDMFGEIIEPGTVLGPLSADIAEQTGLGEVPVVAVCGHDTSAALAAVPAEGDNWDFLSCGTWSILGTRVDQPINTPECLAAGFTNEYTYGGWYIGRNIIGLWLVQELRRKWDTSNDPWDYVRMTNDAACDTAAEYAGLVDVAHPSLMAPSDMEDALRTVLSESGQEPPKTRGQLVRAVLRSLAMEYAWGMGVIEHLTGRKKDTLYMVGGGIANQLLCQFTANACGLPVHAGADQCTAMGNALLQAVGIGAIAGEDDVRRIVRNSVEITTYLPRDTTLWQEQRKTYKTLYKS